MSLAVLEADYTVPWSYDFRNAPEQQRVLIAAKGVTENDRVGFGHFNYGQGWVWDDNDPIVPGRMLYAWAPSPRFPTGGPNGPR